MNHDSSAVGSPLDLDGQWGTRKVVNGPERQMMAEREGGREDPFFLLLSSPTPLATAPLLQDVVALVAAHFLRFPTTILCFLTQGYIVRFKKNFPTQDIADAQITL